MNKIITFFRETRREIGKVTWPTRKEVVWHTGLIVLMALAGGLFFLVVDSILGYMVRHLLGMAS